jgi:hypothetical protein
MATLVGSAVREAYPADNATFHAYVGGLGEQRIVRSEPAVSPTDTSPNAEAFLQVGDPLLPRADRLALTSDAAERCVRSRREVWSPQQTRTWSAR